MEKSHRTHLNTKLCILPEEVDYTISVFCFDNTFSTKIPEWNEWAKSAVMDHRYVAIFSELEVLTTTHDVSIAERDYST